MSYLRVIPRDLFNESKLLKCLGQLSLIAHDGIDSNRNPARFQIEHDGEAFNIEQDPGTGNLYCSNIQLMVRSEAVFVGSRYNSKSPFPLVFGVDEEPVFNDDGSLSDEFMVFTCKELKMERVTLLTLESKPGDLVYWHNVSGTRKQGRLVEFDNGTAIVVLPNGNETSVRCS